MLTRRMFVRTTLGVSLTCLLDTQAFSKDPVRIIVPFAAGASTDIVTRQIAPKVGELLNETVIVENQGGAGGVIGTRMAATAPADGNTLLVATTSHTAQPALQEKLPYDTLKDFVSIALIADMPGIIVANPALPVKSLPELLEYAKSHTVTFGTAGSGTFPHLGIELLKSRAKVPMVHVPYRGAAPALSDTVAGHVDVKLDAYISAGQHIAAGRLRALAVTSTQRLPELPDVPTVAELGFPGYEVTYWIGIVARAGITSERRDILERAFIESLTPENREALIKKGTRPLGLNGKELQGLIEREVAQWRDLITSLGIKPN